MAFGDIAPDAVLAAIQIPAETRGLAIAGTPPRTGNGTVAAGLDDLGRAERAKHYTDDRAHHREEPSVG